MVSVPVPASRDPRLTGFLLLSITVLGWGLNWPAVKFLLREWPPLFARGVAGTTAALILAAVALAKGQSLRIPLRALPAMIAGAFTNVFAWMGFGTVMMKYLTISEGSLLAYTMPIWTALFAWPFLGERPTVRSLAALALGLSGILLLFAGPGVAIDQSKTFGILLALSAAILFALGSVALKAKFPLDPIPLTAWQVGLGCAPMIVIGCLFEHPDIGALTPAGATALVYMTFGPMLASYLAWFGALRRLPVATATMGTLGVPIVGVVGGALMLGEPLGWREALAVALTLSGVALTVRRSQPPPVIE